MLPLGSRVDRSVAQLIRQTVAQPEAEDNELTKDAVHSHSDVYKHTPRLSLLLSLARSLSLTRETLAQNKKKMGLTYRDASMPNENERKSK